MRNNTVDARECKARDGCDDVLGITPMVKRYTAAYIPMDNGMSCHILIIEGWEQPAYVILDEDGDVAGYGNYIYLKELAPLFLGKMKMEALDQKVLDENIVLRPGDRQHGLGCPRCRPIH